MSDGPASVTLVTVASDAAVPLGRPLAVREKRARLVALEHFQGVERQLGFAPQVATVLDAPATTTPFCRELCDEHAKSRLELGEVAVVARQSGVGRQHPRSCGWG